MVAGHPHQAEERARGPRLALVLAGACGLVAVYAGWSVLDVGGDRVTGLFSSLIGAAAPAATLVLSARRALVPADRGTRLGWLFLSLAFVGFTVGDGTSAVYVAVFGTQPPFPSVADAGYAFGIPMVVPSLFYLGGQTAGGSRLRFLLDGAIVASALLLVSWLTFLRSAFLADSDTWLHFALGLAYPIGDVILTVVAVSILSRSRRRDPALLLVTLGIVAGAFGDSAFAYLFSIGLSRASYVVETGYFASSVLIGLASLLPPASRPRPLEAALSRWQIALPYVPVVPSCALVIATMIRGERLDLVTIGLTGVATGLVVGRQLSAMIRSQALATRLSATLATLEHTAAEREVLLEEAPVGICRLDAGGRLVAVNQSFLNVLGYARSQVLGRPFTHFLSPEDRQRVEAAYRTLADGRTDHLAMESRFLRRSGTVIWCSQVVSVVRDAAGAPGSFISIVEDVSERRRQAELAAQIQRGLLPGAAPDLVGYQVAGVCLPAEDVAGDFYDWVAEDGCLDLTVADVMGKGVAAALVMAVLRTALRSCPPSAAPAERVRVADESMSLGDHGIFVTLFHCRLDTATGDLRYVDAGHGYCAIVRATGEVVHLATGSLPLGVMDRQTFAEGTARLEPGDALVLYSDGLVEREDRTASLVEVGRGLGDASGAADSVQRLLAAMPGPSTDDVTVVVLRRDPEAVARAASRTAAALDAAPARQWSR